MANKNRLSWLLLALLICSCSAPREVIVVERKTVDRRVETEKLGGNHIRIVQSGDTLHAIAFGNGLNVNELASWNGLVDTSTLQIGHRIRLTKPLNFKQPKRQPVKAVVVSKPSETKKTSIALPKIKNKNKPKVSSVKTWHWPVKGKVINTFSSLQRQQGIDIAAKQGQAVLATQAGEVVYVGNGLKGYGNLVIIKHNDHYLSAYAHNQEAFVKEGQIVKAKSRIGSVGLNKQRKYALHFQIRKDGTPVNPMTFLPKR